MPLVRKDFSRYKHYLNMKKSNVFPSNACRVHELHNNRYVFTLNKQ